MRLSGKGVDVSRYGVEASWRQTVRILVSVLLAWFFAAVFGLHETIWALITALIVTQSSIAQTITTARDQIVGTLIGAVVGTLAISLRPLLDQYWLPFWLALVPLAALAAWRPSLRFAGVTLMIVYLLPSTGNPFTPLTERLAAIFLGVLVSVAVSYVVFHADARRRAFLIAAQMFRHLNELLQAALLRSESWRQLEARGELCVPLLAQLNDCVVEARRERITDLERRHPVLVVLPSLMRHVMSDTMLIARAIEAGKDSKGSTAYIGCTATSAMRIAVWRIAANSTLPERQQGHPSDRAGTMCWHRFPISVGMRCRRCISLLICWWRICDRPSTY
ncbi:hypothetical protein A0U93_13570 [Neoasaia chiangmaiensis]|uniref:Integral membrane bound transporter domain-containing protein n=1 Tax=Neoasaia chiangmaiensis TaxID=320497 RepID=A0A1U9KSG7_9PROT|nr:FUSC family protein [Neoasaia chiangmaiensis]AQS88781.1 hypothetical protein A0U93_13570 [Neoasaia chiangmaiensis]